MPTNPYASPRSLRAADHARRLAGCCIVVASVVLAYMIQRFTGALCDIDTIVESGDTAFAATFPQATIIRINWTVVGPLLAIAFGGVLLVIAPRRKMS